MARRVMSPNAKLSDRKTDMSKRETPRQNSEALCPVIVMGSFHMTQTDDIAEMSEAIWRPTRRAHGWIANSEVRTKRAPLLMLTRPQYSMSANHLHSGHELTDPTSSCW